jgi:hypothetical protein
MTRLKKLNLDHTGITDEGLKEISEWTNLEEVSIRWTKTTGAGLTHLKNLGKFNVLMKTRSSSDDAAVKALHEALPSLQIFE